MEKEQRKLPEPQPDWASTWEKEYYEELWDYVAGVVDWDEQIQRLKEQGYLTGDNTTYDPDLT